MPMKAHHGIYLSPGSPGGAIDHMVIALETMVCCIAMVSFCIKMCQWRHTVISPRILSTHAYVLSEHMCLSSSWPID